MWIVVSARYIQIHYTRLMSCANKTPNHVQFLIPPVSITPYRLELETNLREV